MVARALAIFVLILSLAASSQAADPQLVIKLKELGTAVDTMSVHISTAASDAEAQQMAVAVQQAFANGLSADKPDIRIDATQGNCTVTIKTSEWELWSQAQNGKIVNHGAKIN
jgi:hypothetical protein